MSIIMALLLFPMQHAAENKDHVNVVQQVLLEHKANMEIKDSNGDTAMTLPQKLGHNDIVKSMRDTTKRQRQEEEARLAEAEQRRQKEEEAR
jgi:ankyrin repeat protein